VGRENDVSHMRIPFGTAPVFTFANLITGSWLLGAVVVGGRGAGLKNWGAALSPTSSASGATVGEHSGLVDGQRRV